MKFFKPQHALVQTAPTQFGSAAQMGISIGCGFRLSDTRVLLHEASVWQAFMAAPLTSPVMEMALPKHSAEWLLGGHATCVAGREEADRLADWEASVSLDGKKKTIHCSARVAPSEAAASATLRYRATLPVDYPQAMRDSRGRQNPVGMNGPGALKLMGPLGPVGHPLAAMGPLQTQWETRASLAPSRSAVLDPFGRDGSHMGWPARMDLRYFQLAPPDQQSRGKNWREGAPFELHGFGPDGLGYRGHLPALQAQAMIRKREQQAWEALLLSPQTVWFLPDHDTGVIWWHGMVPIDSVLSDEIEVGVLALREPGRLLSANRFAEIVASRTSHTLSEVAPLKDSDLLPERARGWTWTLVLNAEDHLSRGNPSLSYEALQSRIDEFEAHLFEAQRNGAKAEALNEEVANAPWLQAQALDTTGRLSDAEARAAFHSPVDGVLSHRRMEGASLPGLQVDGLRVMHVRLQQCDIGASVWKNCHFEDVDFEACNLRESRWDTCSFVRCRFTGSELGGVTFSACDQQQASMDRCTVSDSSFVGGQWDQVSLQRLKGARMSLENMQWNSVSWLECDLPQSNWCALYVLRSNVIECRMPASTVRECEFEGFGVTDTDLRNSVWQTCQGESVNFASGADLGYAQISDCSFEKTSWIAVKAQGIRVTDSKLQPLVAQRLDASNSTWLKSVLSEANLMHANLSASIIDATSLKDANLHGADLRACKISNCNLIRLQAGWVLGAEALDGGDNLTARLQRAPRRPQ